MDFDKQCILIVEDTPANIEVVSSFLSDQYQIRVATNGQRAIEICRGSITIDLILLDIMMPQMDGYEVCRILKKDPKTSEIPVIFLTGKDDSESLVRGFETGACDYLTKPFKPSELMARVHTHLTLNAQKKEIGKKNLQLNQLIRVMSHDLSNHLSVINMGLELTEANADPYWDRIKLAAHNSMDIICLVREMSTIQKGGITLHSVDLHAAVTESETLVETKLREKNLSVDNSLEPGIQVRAEKRSLVNSVLNNLFTNSIKFSERDGTIEIRGRLDEDRYIMEFVDHGIGIPDSILAKIFDFGKAISRKGTAGEPGTGFGMANMKLFMEKYGAEIEVESFDIQKYPENHGTTIRLSFLVPE